MAKKKSSKSKAKPAKPRAAAPRQKKKSYNPSKWLVRPSTATENDALFRKIFYGLSIVIFLITSGLALNSGINGDDEYQNDYSERLTSFYTTGNTDTLAIDETARDPYNKGKMYYYGGFFDTVTGLTNHVLGYTKNDIGYHNVRHLWNALFGFLAMFFTALLAKEIAGWRAAILTLVLMFLSPRFLGHSLMNPKDIPFAMGYVMSIYFMVRMFREMPKFNWKLALGVAIGMAIAIATRAGGLILVGILGLYAGLDFLMKNGFGGLTDVKKIGVYAAHGIGISVVGLLVAVLFWPWAMESPLSNPFEALGAFEKLEIKIRVLFAGLNTMSDHTPWHYAPSWIWRTIPLFTLLGFLGCLALLPKVLKKYQPLPVAIAIFAAIFPVFYVIWKDSVLHDGWRHLTFVYPTMVVMASLFFLTLEDVFSKNKIGKMALYVIVGLMALEPAVYILRNASVPYTYFSPAAGGISAAFGNYETDYWGVSCRQAMEWMEDEGILSDDMTEQVTIATSFVHPVKTYLAKYGDKVRVIYQRFNQRYERPWDYGIFPSRYIRGPHLRKGTWPNTRSVHEVTASGVPLVSVEKGGGAMFEGEKLFKERNYELAAAAFEREIADHPTNELAWQKLTMSYVNIGDFAAAKTAATNMLDKVAPDNTSALFYRGLASLNLKDLASAEADFKQSVKVNEDLGSSWYYLALIEYNRKNSMGALNNLQTAIEKAPRFKPAYELAAQIYEEQGNSQRAAQFRQAAAGM